MSASIHNDAMSDRSTRVAICGLVALAVAMGIGRFAFTPLLPMMQGDAGLTVVQGGWLASANYIGYLAGGLSAVALRMPAARAIHLGLAIVAGSTLAMGLVSSLPAWFVLRALAGLASAWVLIYASSWCLDRFEHAAPARERALLSATVFAGVGVGIAVAGAFCALLLTARASSTSAWLGLGIVALAASASIWRQFQRASAGAPATPGGARARWDLESIRLIVCYGVFGFGYIIPATFLSAMAREAASDPAIYGWSWPLFGAAAAASTFLAAALRRVLGERSLWIAGHLVMAAGVVMPMLWPGFGGIVVSALLVGGTFMAVTMVGMQEARRVAGPGARALIAAMTSAFAAGQIAGPLLVSALAARHGFTPALLIAGGALVASAVALLPIPTMKRPP